MGRYKTITNGSSSNTGKGVAPYPTPRCSSYWKGSPMVAPDCSRHQQLICRGWEYLISYNWVQINYYSNLKVGPKLDRLYNLLRGTPSHKKRKNIKVYPGYDSQLYLIGRRLTWSTEERGVPFISIIPRSSETQCCSTCPINGSNIYVQKLFRFDRTMCKKSLETTSLNM